MRQWSFEQPEDDQSVTTFADAYWRLVMSNDWETRGLTQIEALRKAGFSRNDLACLLHMFAEAEEYSRLLAAAENSHANLDACFEQFEAERVLPAPPADYSLIYELWLVHPRIIKSLRQCKKAMDARGLSPDVWVSAVESQIQQIALQEKITEDAVYLCWEIGARKKFPGNGL